MAKKCFWVSLPHCPTMPAAYDQNLKLSDILRFACLDLSSCISLCMQTKIHMHLQLIFIIVYACLFAVLEKVNLGQVHSHVCRLTMTWK